MQCHVLLCILNFEIWNAKGKVKRFYALWHFLPFENFMAFFFSYKIYTSFKVRVVTSVLLFCQSLELSFYQDFLLDQFDTFALFSRINGDERNTFWKIVHLKFKSFKPLFMWFDEKLQILLTLLVLKRVLIWFSSHVFPFKYIYCFTVFSKTASNFNELSFVWIILEHFLFIFFCILTYHVQFKIIIKP